MLDIRRTGSAPPKSPQSDGVAEFDHLACAPSVGALTVHLRRTAAVKPWWRRLETCDGRETSGNVGDEAPVGCLTVHLRRTAAVKPWWRLLETCDGRETSGAVGDEVPVGALTAHRRGAVAVQR